MLDKLPRLANRQVVAERLHLYYHCSSLYFTTKKMYLGNWILCAQFVSIFMWELCVYSQYVYICNAAEWISLSCATIWRCRYTTDMNSSMCQMSHFSLVINFSNSPRKQPNSHMTVTGPHNL